MCLVFGVFKGVSVWLRDVDMQYPQIMHLHDGTFITPSPYPGEDYHTHEITYEYFRHHHGWTRSQEFNDYIAIHNMPQQDVNMIMHLHELWMSWIARVNGFKPLDLFRRLVLRLVKRVRQEAVRRDSCL